MNAANLSQNSGDAKDPNLNLQRFLHRIAYHDPVDRSYRTLAGIILQFLRTVPFENMDIVWGRRVSLQPSAVFDKIVRQRRGGFCYECNGLLADMLLLAGFEVQFLSARMVTGGVIGPEFDHMVLLVPLDQPYLVDVGNGKSFQQPLPLVGKAVVTAESVEYRAVNNLEHVVEQREPGGTWEPRFLFSTKPRRREDFKAMCHYHQTSPESTFVQKRLATLARENGRVTLLNDVLTLTQGTQRTATEITTDEQLHLALWQHFGIVRPLEETP